MDEFDYVLAMDREVMGYLRRYATGTQGELRMFLDYAVEEGTVKTSDVPDPYYDGRFELVYNLVQHGCRALLAHIRSEHNI
jgi:protein-tyrosine phosphatase